jgi:hypothetical protein
MVWAALASVAVAGTATSLIVFSYYRWSSAPATTCDEGMSNVAMHFANTPIEWNAIGPGDSVINHFVVNGVDNAEGPFDLPDGTGSSIFGPFSDYAPAYPFHYEFRLETTSTSGPIWESALTATCTRTGSPTAVVIHWIPGQTQRYYRWRYAPPVTCQTTGGGVSLTFPSQPREWKNLPADATYASVYETDDAEITIGAVDAPDGTGSTTFATLEQPGNAYPIHYAYRLQTFLSGALAYESTLIAACTADGPGTSALFNVPEPGSLGAGVAAVGAIALRRRRAA